MRTPIARKHLPLCTAFALVMTVGTSALLAAPGCSSSSGGTCGNGKLDPGEQCDDGNQTSLDGCSSTCRFEEVQRMNSFVVQYAADNSCPHDAFGSAIGSFLRSALQSEIDAAVKSGSFTILMPTLSASDPSGGDEASVTVGFLPGTPEDTDGGTPYDGSSDLDWWYAPAASALTNGLPTTQLTGSIAQRTLHLGPASVEFSFGSGSPVAMSNLTISSQLGTATAPLESTNGSPPGHLASENLDPTLLAVENAGTSLASIFCGNVSAQSLQTTALPSTVSQYCTNYTTANSLLDLFVGGCSVTLLGSAISATQPDQVDASKPAAGAGGPYKLTADSSTHIVNGCKDKSGAAATLATCLAAASYSTYFQFTSDRVIIR